MHQVLVQDANGMCEGLTAGAALVHRLGADTNRRCSTEAGTCTNCRCSTGVDVAADCDCYAGQGANAVPIAGAGMEKRRWGRYQSQVQYRSEVQVRVWALVTGAAPAKVRMRG